LRGLFEQYALQSGSTLEKDIEKEISGDLKKVLLAISIINKLFICFKMILKFYLKKKLLVLKTNKLILHLYYTKLLKE
jgi:hypothetical protein